MRTYSQKPCSLSIRQQISWECWFCDAKQTSSVDILQIYGTCQKMKIPSRMLQNTQKGTNNIKTNTSPGGLADRHSRQPRLLDICFFLYCWYLSMLSASLELVFAFLLGSIQNLCNYFLQLLILEGKTRISLLLRLCLDGADWLNLMTAWPWLQKLIKSMLEVSI